VPDAVAGDEVLHAGYLTGGARPHGARPL
jgi:hypothetical protein